MTLWTFNPSSISPAEGSNILISTAAPQSWNDIQKNGTGTFRWYSVNGGEAHLESQSGTNEYAQARRNNLNFAQLLAEAAFTKTPAPNIETRLFEFRSSSSPTFRAAHANVGTDNKIKLFDHPGNLLHTFATDLDTLTSWRFAMGVKPGTTSTNGSVHAYLYAAHDATSAVEQFVFDNRNAGLTNISELRLGWAVNTIWKLQLRHMRMEDSSIAPLGPLSATTPVIDLGADRTGIEALEVVNLTAAHVGGNAPSSYTWRHVSGPAVTLTGTGNTRSFVAPATFNGGTVVIGCTPNGGVEDLVSITVLPTPSWVRIPGQTEWLPSRKEQRIVW